MKVEQIGSEVNVRGPQDNIVRDLYFVAFGVGQAALELAQLTQRLRFPPVLHSSRVLILPNASALSASSAAISSIISCGLRCFISSPPFGFFTDRSKVFLLMVLAS